MFHKSRTSSLVLVNIVGLAAMVASLAIAQPEPPRQGGDPPAGGPNAQEIQACLAAAAPGKEHALLVERVGRWLGKTQMWFGPDAPEAARGECTWTFASLLGGRYVRGELSATLPGLGEFNGVGVTGFDNVSRTFVATWIDDHSTGIMNGEGTLSEDGRTLSWRYAYNCPIRGTAATVRQVETLTDADSIVFEMFTTDPASGREYKCMHIDLTRQP